MDVRIQLWRKLSTEELMLLNCGVGEDSWESLGLQGNQENQSWIFVGRIDAEVETLNTLATWCKQLTHWKRPWCWERLKAGGEGDKREWDGWMASLTQWTWVRASSGSWWRIGKPGMLPSMDCKESDMTEQLNWTVTLAKINTFYVKPLRFRILLP